MSPLWFEGLLGGVDAFCVGDRVPTCGVGQRTTRWSSSTTKLDAEEYLGLGSIRVQSFDDGNVLTIRVERS